MWFIKTKPIQFNPIPQHLWKQNKKKGKRNEEKKKPLFSTLFNYLNVE